MIVLVIFGPKRLPGVGRALGQGMREFKDSITGKDRGGDDEDRGELPPAAPARPAAGTEEASRALGRDE